jgi:hypothetical protein
MDKKKTKPPEKKEPTIWHPQQERILKTWGEAAACYRYMNNQAYLLYKKLSMRFTIPVIVLSTVTGTANFAQGSFPPAVQPMVPSVIGFMNLVAGLLATIMQFLKVNELMEGHRVASLQYGKLSRTIRLELSLPIEERNHNGADLIESCKADYDRLIEQSPQIPYEILKKFERKFPGDSTFFKPEIMHIHPITTFVSEEDLTNYMHRDLNVIKLHNARELNDIVIKSSTVDELDTESLRK